jgi:hypothetical protein
MMLHAMRADEAGEGLLQDIQVHVGGRRLILFKIGCFYWSKAALRIDLSMLRTSGAMQGRNSRTDCCGEKRDPTLGAKSAKLTTPRAGLLVKIGTKTQFLSLTDDEIARLIA